MKKALAILLISIVMVTALSAYEGSTSVSFAYTYEEGNKIGISSDTAGYFDSSLGFYLGVESVFNVKDFSDWEVGLIVGPSYSYSFSGTGVSIIASVGLSGESTMDHCAFGIGSYFGGEWRVTERFGLGVGVKLGNNFVSIPFDDPSITANSRFFVTPIVGVEFCY